MDTVVGLGTPLLPLHRLLPLARHEIPMNVPCDTVLLPWDPEMSLVVAACYADLAALC